MAQDQALEQQTMPQVAKQAPPGCFSHHQEPELTCISINNTAASLTSSSIQFGSPKTGRRRTRMHRTRLLYYGGYAALWLPASSLESCAFHTPLSSLSEVAGGSPT
eukprot:1157200-Pelagomonas_calceolata.AAC.3